MASRGHVCAVFGGPPLWRGPDADDGYGGDLSSADIDFWTLQKSRCPKVWRNKSRIELTGAQYRQNAKRTRHIRRDLGARTRTQNLHTFSVDFYPDLLRRHPPSTITARYNVSPVRTFGSHRRCRRGQQLQKHGKAGALYLPHGIAASGAPTT
jgi:hypothetical protein